MCWEAGWSFISIQFIYAFIFLTCTKKIETNWNVLKRNFTPPVETQIPLLIKFWRERKTKLFRLMSGNKSQELRINLKYEIIKYENNVNCEKINFWIVPWGKLREEVRSRSPWPEHVLDKDMFIREKVILWKNHFLIVFSVLNIHF